MHKEDSEPKTPDKFIVENSLFNQKVKPPKEKKPPKVSSPTPKKIKKKVHFSNSKEVEKDEEKEKIIPTKNSQIKQKINPQSPIPKKSEKTEEGVSPVLLEQKVASEESQVSPTNSKKKEKENLKEIKEKRNWKSWSPQEKILFYEIIANGGNYSSLQKLFKTMNDVRILFNFLFNLINLENRNKKHRKNQRFLLSYAKKSEYFIKKSRRHKC